MTADRISGFKLLCAQTLTQTDRINMTASATETVIPAYAWIPPNAIPSLDSQTSRERCAEIHWTLHGFSNCTAGGATDQITINLYCGATPGSGGTAMWTHPPTFTLPRNALKGFTFNFRSLFQRAPTTTIYGYTEAEFMYSPEGTNLVSSATTTFTATTGVDTATWVLTPITAGMIATTSDFYTGRITGVNDGTDTITVAAWIKDGVAGTPAANSVITISNIAATQQRWAWDPTSQARSLIGLRDGGYYMWLTVVFSSTAASGTFDCKSTIVKGYGLTITE